MPMIGFILFIFATSAIAISTYFLLREKKPEEPGEYVWVGEGENPLK